MNLIRRVSRESVSEINRRFDVPRGRGGGRVPVYARSTVYGRGFRAAAACTVPSGERTLEFRPDARLPGELCGRILIRFTFSPERTELGRPWRNTRSRAAVTRSENDSETERRNLENRESPFLHGVDLDFVLTAYGFFTIPDLNAFLKFNILSTGYLVNTTRHVGFLKKRSDCSFKKSFHLYKSKRLIRVPYIYIFFFNINYYNVVLRSVIESPTTGR